MENSLRGRGLSRAILVAALLAAGNALGANPVVEMKTNMGDVVFELYPEQAPKTVANFLEYVNSDFYDDTVFHRVINNFMVQGGGFDPSYDPKKVSGPIPNEAKNGLLNEEGTLAMARGRDPDSATSQFYINVRRNLFLNHYREDPDYFGYCVFGRVVKGMDVVKKIAATETGPGGPFRTDVPLSPIVIKDVEVVPPVLAAKLLAEARPSALKPPTAPTKKAPAKKAKAKQTEAKKTVKKTDTKQSQAKPAAADKKDASPAKKPRSSKKEDPPRG